MSADPTEKIAVAEVLAEIRELFVDYTTGECYMRADNEVCEDCDSSDEAIAALTQAIDYLTV